MLQKLNSVHASNKSFLKPRNIHDTRFGIAHFAGDVYYQAAGERSSACNPSRVRSGYHGKEVARGTEKDECGLLLSFPSPRIQSRIPARDPVHSGQVCLPHVMPVYKVILDSVKPTQH